MSNGQDYRDLDAQVLSFVARKVRGQLAERERTQTDAAEVLDLSQAAVSRRVKGQVAFTVTELSRPRRMARGAGNAAAASRPVVPAVRTAPADDEATPPAS